MLVVIVCLVILCRTEILKIVASLTTILLLLNIYNKYRNIIWGKKKLKNLHRHDNLIIVEEACGTLLAQGRGTSNARPQPNGVGDNADETVQQGGTRPTGWCIGPVLAHIPPVSSVAQ